MSENEIQLSRDGIALLVTLMFTLLLGGYFIGTDLYHYNDPESATSVLMLYSLLGVFGTLFLLGKKAGPMLLMYLSVILMIAQIGYVMVFISGLPTGSEWHDPSENWFITGLDIVLSLLVFVFSFRIYREKYGFQ